MNELRNIRRKRNYSILRKYGFTAQEATKYKDYSKREISKLIGIKHSELKKEFEEWRES